MEHNKGGGDSNGNQPLRNPFDVKKAIREEIERRKDQKMRNRYNSLNRMCKHQVSRKIIGTFQQYRLQQEFGVDLDIGSYDSGENPGNRD